MKSKTLTLFQKAVILVAVPLTFELLLLGTVLGLLVQAEKEAKQANHAKAVIAKTNEVVQLLFDVGYAFVAYDAKTNSISGDRLNQVLDRTPKELSALAELVQAEPAHAALVHNVIDYTQENIRTVVARKKAIESGGHLDLMEAFNLRQNLNETVQKLDTIIRDEKAKQSDNEAADKLNALIKLALISGVATSVFIAALLVVRFHQSTTSRLSVLMDNTVKLGAGASLGEVLTGTDEIAQLDQVLHTSADVIAESQRKERAVIENAVDVICSINADGRFATVSLASTKLWGYQPEQLIGKQWHEIIIADDRERSTSWAKQIRKMSDSTLENQIERRDGSQADMRWSGHWSESDQALFCVAHDMSERIEMERFKQQFVSMISHDLRTPLSAVKSTLELLGAGALGSLSEKGQTKVGRAEENLRHTIELINNLLDLEKMESNRMELDARITALKPILDRALEAVSALAERKRIKINDPNCSVEVVADEQRLTQLVINLLGNAIKFSPDGSKITVAVEQIGLMVRVSISDTGPGIPSDQLESIFDRYHQTKSAATAKVEGTGLGLAICKAIAEAHKGSIGVESTEGKGSTFWFSVPHA